MRPASTNIKTDGSVSVWGCCMSNMRRYRPHDPSPSVAEPRRPLLLGAYSFVRDARLCPGVRRIALLGSLATAKAIPKDVDLLVTVERAIDLSQRGYYGAYAADDDYGAYAAGGYPGDYYGGYANRSYV